MQTKSEMINRIAELAKENAELKAENTALKKDIKACNTCEHSTKIYGNEIAELQAELQNFKDMAKKGLDEFKDVGGCWGCGLQLRLNHDMEYIKQLKAENERLKEENKTLEQFLSKEPLALQALQKGYVSYKESTDVFYQMVKTYKQTLQEIKAIAECVIDNDNSLKTDHCFGYCDECSSFKHCKLYPYWQITQLITKAESEG